MHAWHCTTCEYTVHQTETNITDIKHVVGMTKNIGGQGQAQNIIWSIRFGYIQWWK